MKRKGDYLRQAAAAYIKPLANAKPWTVVLPLRPPGKRTIV